MGRLRILGSSSSGNSALLSVEGSHVLIDAGLSGRRTVELLREERLDPESINGVCLTHEHSDHAKGTRGLARLKGLPFYANYQTARSVQGKLSTRLSWKLFEQQDFVVGPLKVSPLPVPHDAYDPVCFIIEWGNGDLFSPVRSIAWVNDLGHVPRALLHRLAQVDVLVIEANHDEAMLEADPKRPLYLKQRIRSRHGHLSNRMTLEALQSVDRPRWKHLILTHLSRDCNDPSLVRDTFAPLQDTLPNLSIQVIDPDCQENDPFTF